MKSVRIAALVAVLLAAPLAAAPAAHAADISTATTDAALCAQIGRAAYGPDNDGNYVQFGQVDIPGAGTKTNFACGAELPLNKPLSPTDGTPVTVNTGLGAFAFPCPLAPARGMVAATQYDYLGTWNSTFKFAPQNTWDERKAYWEARQRAQYMTYTVWIADKPGTFTFNGEFTDSTGDIKKCNLTVNVTDKPAADSVTAAPASNPKCAAAKKTLAAAKAKGTKKQVAAAKKKVTATCQR